MAPPRAAAAALCCCALRGAAAQAFCVGDHVEVAADFVVQSATGGRDVLLQSGWQGSVAMMDWDRRGVHNVLIHFDMSGRQRKEWVGSSEFGNLKFSAPADHYVTLGVDRAAGEAEIKRRFRALARQWHPDTTDEAAAKGMMEKINVAYATLRDPEKRAKYDLTLGDRVTGSHGCRGPRASPFGGAHTYAPGTALGGDMYATGGMNINRANYRSMFTTFTVEEAELFLMTLRADALLTLFFVAVVVCGVLQWWHRFRTNERPRGPPVPDAELRRRMLCAREQQQQRQHVGRAPALAARGAATAARPVAAGPLSSPQGPYCSAASARGGSADAVRRVRGGDATVAGGIM